MLSLCDRVRAVLSKCHDRALATVLSAPGRWKLWSEHFEDIRMDTMNSKMLLYPSCVQSVLNMSMQLRKSVKMSRQWMRGTKPEAQRIANMMASTSKKKIVIRQK